MGDYYKLNDLGEPVPCGDVMDWAEWFETANTKRVLARTDVDGSRISTVFLGIDHSFGHGTPLLWETLVFGGPLDGEMYRYETRLQAQRGHEEMVTKVRAAQGPGVRKIELEDDDGIL